MNKRPARKRRRPAAPDCVGAIRRLTVDRERAAVQNEIDRLQRTASLDDGTLASLWERKIALQRRLEELA